MNAAEDRLSELMDAATARRPPLDAILAEGERRGRTRRRRRRAAMAGVTAAAVLFAAGGVTLAARADRELQDDMVGNAAAGSRPATSPPVSRSPTAAVVGGAPTPSRTSGDPLVPITATAAVNILRRIASPKWQYGAYNPMSTARCFGSTSTTAMASPRSSSTSARWRTAAWTDRLRDADRADRGAANARRGGPAGCTVRTFANGDRAMQEVLKADTYGEYQYRIIVSRADGVALEITAANGDWNSPGHRGHPGPAAAERRPVDRHRAQPDLAARSADVADPLNHRERTGAPAPRRRARASNSCRAARSANPA